MSKITGTLRKTRDEILTVEWQIDDFLSLSGSTGSYYVSPDFGFSDSYWRLTIYPYGQSREGFSPNWIGVYLSRIESYSTEIVTYDVHVKKADGILPLKKNLTWKFDGAGGYGEKRFLERSELLQQRDELLPSDALTIICVLKKHSLSQELNTLCTGLKNILVSKSYSDVTINVGEEVHEAHRNILAASSPVFAAMFRNEMSEKNSGAVSIADCDPKSFKDFLHFLYTCKVDITESNVFHLYRTAHKYCVEELMSHCVAFMIDNISVDNVCDVAALGDQYSDENLDCCTQSFFKKNIQSILLTSKWESLQKENYLVANKLLRNVASKIKIED